MRAMSAMTLQPAERTSSVVLPRHLYCSVMTSPTFQCDVVAQSRACRIQINVPDEDVINIYDAKQTMAISKWFGSPKQKGEVYIKVGKCASLESIHLLLKLLEEISDNAFDEGNYVEGDSFYLSEILDRLRKGIWGHPSTLMMFLERELDLREVKHKFLTEGKVGA